MIHCISGYIKNVKQDNDYVVLIHCPEMYDLSLASKYGGVGQS